MNKIHFILLCLCASAFNVAYSYGNLSPYAYCSGNPISYVDPSGCEIRGVSREDAAMAVQDIRAIFPGDDFEQFRNLIVQSGKNHDKSSLEKINNEALSTALNGLTLNEDQQAMVDIVVNTINSKSIHYIEYVALGDIMSFSGSMAIKDHSLFDLQPTIDKIGGVPSIYIDGYGGAITVHTKEGSYSAVLNEPYPHLNGRSVATGHELFGHGRSLSLGRTSDVQQHIDAIQTENLILRMMGIQYINSGIDHGLRTIVPYPTALPGFR